MRVIVVAGARPNFMKIAPILRAADAAGVEALLVHTGQHYDANMSYSIFRDLGMREPDINFHVASGTHAEQTAAVMTAFDAYLVSVDPDAVVVVGDVNSTIACSLVAVKRGVPVAHVEAGLRSFDRTMPEEINRLVVDSIAEWLLTPSADADENLRVEGHHAAKIIRVGNVMVDSLDDAMSRIDLDEATARLGLPERFGLVTLHRAALVDDPALLAHVLETLGQISEDLPLVFPVHPRTRHAMAAAGLEHHRGITVLEPMGYLDFVASQAAAKVVLTDSGGLQEETTCLGTPCVTLREQTERPITVTEGTNTVVGFDRDLTTAAVAAAMAHDGTPRRPELWDGHTAERIIDAIGTRVADEAWLPYASR